MTRSSDHYAVIGNPVAHSRSPAIHAAFARQTGQALVYDRLFAPEDAFTTTVETFFTEGGAGLNVTLPFKHEAARFANLLATRAARAGAVNTLTRQDNGRIAGDNTDGIGLLRDLTRRLGIELHGARVLILGAGGAVRGVVPVLLEHQPAVLQIANRTRAKAESMARDFADLGTIAASPLDQLDGGWDIVINAISSGLSGEMPDIEPRVISDAHAAYDMIYADAPTPFLRWARTHGVRRRCDGFGMLVEQAAESFHIWRGVRPDTEPVIRTLRPGAYTSEEAV